MNPNNQDPAALPAPQPGGGGEARCSTCGGLRDENGGCSNSFHIPRPAPIALPVRAEEETFILAADDEYVATTDDPKVAAFIVAALNSTTALSRELEEAKAGLEASRAIFTQVAESLKAERDEATAEVQQLKEVQRINSELEAEQSHSSYQRGYEDALSGEHELLDSPEHPPFPEFDAMKPVAKFRRYRDSGDSSVGIPASEFWELSPDQAGTILAELAALNSPRSETEGRDKERETWKVMGELLDALSERDKLHPSDCDLNLWNGLCQRIHDSRKTLAALRSAALAHEQEAGE